VLGVVGLNAEGLGPEIWGKVLVGLLEGDEGSLDEVLGSSGMTRGGGVAIIDTSELKELLGDWSTDNTSTTWGWDELDTDGSALSGNLAWDSMDGTDLVTPETSSDWHKLELGSDDGSLDGNLNFLGDLDSETNVTVLVTNGNDSLEAGSLTGLGLLLHRDDLHDLIGDSDLWAGLLDELVDNLGLLDWDGVSVDLLKRVDKVSLNESSELGLWNPLVLSWATSAATESTAATTASASSSESSSTAFTASSWSLLSHFFF